MCIAQRLLLSTSEISDATASMPSPGYFALQHRVAPPRKAYSLTRRLSSHSAHSTHFPFSNRFLEVPYNDAGRIHDTIYHYSTPLYYLFPEYFGATADAAFLCSLLFRTVP